jgi:hypothetical protein
LLNLLRDILVAVVEAPREATHDFEVWLLGCRVNNILADLHICGEWLLAQNVEIFLNCLKGFLGVD